MQGELIARPDDSEYVAFRGIPFAAPPVGDLRWRAPKAPKAWDGVRDATVFAPDCAQLGPGWPSLGPKADARVKDGASEDCLYLQVYAPKGAREGAPLPVLVYIPAGDFMYGGG